MRTRSGGWRRDEAAVWLAGCAYAAPLEPVEPISGVDGRCGFEAEGRPLTATALAKTRRAWRGRKVLIFSGLEVPYRCLTPAMGSLEQGGHDDVSFVANPPHEP